MIPLQSGTISHLRIIIIVEIWADSALFFIDEKKFANHQFNKSILGIYISR